MKFTIDQKQLVQALAQCQGFTEAKGTMPALAMVLISAKSATSFAATDLNRSIFVETVSETIDVAGSIAVNARSLLDRAKALTGSVTISTDGTAVTLSSGKRRFRMQGISSDELPTMPQRDDAMAPMLEMTGDDLAALLDAVKFSVSTDETRLHLNSLMIESTGDVLRAVSTDGHRLTVVERKTATAKAFKVLVPLRSVMEIQKFATAAEDQALKVYGDDRILFVERDGVSMSTKLVDAQFVPWEQVVPKSAAATCIVDRQALLSAVRAVEVAASDRTGGVKLSFEAGHVDVSTEDSVNGEGYDRVEAEFEGQKVEVGFAARYVADALSAIECERVTIGLNGDLDPILVTPESGDGFSATIMPMRI